MNGYQMRVRLWQKIVRLQRLNMALLGICLVICVVQLYSSLMASIITWLYIPFIAMLVCVHLSLKRIRRHQETLANIRVDPQEVTFSP
jgi:hypothetical protein